MSVTRYIASRLSLGGRNRVAAVIAVAGVCCATAVMIITMAVTMGFKMQIRQKLAGFTAAVTITPDYDYALGVQQALVTVDSAKTAAVAAAAGNGARTVTVLRQPGIIKTADDYAALVFTAYDKGHDWSFERANITAGSLPDFSADSTAVVVSGQTARRLGLQVGDKVTACFFAGDALKARRFTVRGIFTSNFADYDATVCYASPAALRGILDAATDQGTSADIILPPAMALSDDSAAAVAERLQNMFLDNVRQTGASTVPVVDNITRSGAVYINWLDMLDTNVAVIFAIMCCVACFTLVSSLFIVILNGVTTIGTLRALGMDGRGVRHVYVAVAMRLVGLGVVLGVALSVTLLLVQQHTGFMELDPQMYYLTSVPVHIDWLATAAIAAGVAVAGWLVLAIPARMASSLPVARTLRFE